MAHVLLTEDDTLVRQTIEQILQLAGHQVSVVCNGREAIEYCSHTQPDLILTDMLMPEMEGVETIVRLKQMAPTIPIIAYSGGGRSERFDFLDIARSIGASAILRKPLMPRELCDTISLVLTGTSGASECGAIGQAQ